MTILHPPRLAVLIVIEVALVAAGAAELLVSTPVGITVDFGCGALAVLSIALRRRWAWLAFALTLPAVATAEILIPTLILLFTVSVGTRRRRWVLAVAGAAVVVLWISPWDYSARISWLYDGLYGVMFGVTPIVLGQLVLARKTLHAQLEELRQARAETRRMIAAEVLRAERTRIAREMHDVVSHQVTLITVQAGALQVGAADPSVKRVGATIRQLCVQTLDELRQMILVLRADTQERGDLRPQPSLARLDDLVSGSGVDVEMRVAPGLAFSAAVERTLFRTVQEGLTNVSKHAPGSSVTLDLTIEGSDVVLVMENTAGDRPARATSTPGHGHIGLRERAELLGGNLAAGPAGGGYRLALRVPLPPAGAPGHQGSPH